RPAVVIFSFPTRRSADLIQKNFDHFIHHGELCAHCLTETRKGIINPLSSVRKEQKAGHVETPARPLAVTSTDELREARLENNSRDRKSTRLNSSHEWIAY